MTNQIRQTSHCRSPDGREPPTFISLIYTTEEALILSATGGFFVDVNVHTLPSVLCTHTVLIMIV